MADDVRGVLRERIAKALYEQESECDWEGLRESDGDRHWYLDLADAVLSALSPEQVGWRDGVSSRSLHDQSAHNWALTQGFNSHLRCVPVFTMEGEK